MKIPSEIYLPSKIPHLPYGQLTLMPENSFRLSSLFYKLVIGHLIYILCNQNEKNILKSFLSKKLVHQTKHPILKLQILPLFHHHKDVYFQNWLFFKISCDIGIFCLFWSSNKNLFSANLNKQQISFKKNQDS